MFALLSTWLAIMLPLLSLIHAPEIRWNLGAWRVEL